MEAYLYQLLATWIRITKEHGRMSEEAAAFIVRHIKNDKMMELIAVSDIIQGMLAKRPTVDGDQADGQT